MKRRNKIAIAIIGTLATGWFYWLQNWLMSPFTEWNENRIGYIQFGMDG